MVLMLNGPYSLLTWLEKLNLEIPETLDELYTVLKAFTDQDRDGNGQNDNFLWLHSY